MKKIIQPISYIIGGALFIYLGALVDFEIPLSETRIPITGQSLAALGRF